MGAWHGAYAELLSKRFGALVAYAGLLVDEPAQAKKLAEDATVAVFSARRSPHSTYEAEVACRHWMATHAGAPERAAVVLMAIDSHDEDAVHRVLRKATPQPLPSVTPQIVEELRRRYVHDATRYAVPSGGVNALLAPALARHRSAVARAVGVAATAVAVAGAVAYFGVPHLPVSASAGGPTASASPSATMLAVTWDPEPDYDAALAGFDMPQCGDTFVPESRSVGGVTPSPRGTVEVDPNYGRFVMLDAAFTTDEEGAQWLLAVPSSFVVTRDDVVVMTARTEYSGMEVFLANAPTTGGLAIARSSFCDAQVESDELARRLEYLDYESATPEERAAYDAEWEKFGKKWTEFEPGVYRAYAVTPIVFGEQAALGQVFSQEGVNQMQYVMWDISYSPLAADPRLAPYCSGSSASDDMTCRDVPAGVLREVLTRNVDPATVDHTAPGMGISSPLILAVD